MKTRLRVVGGPDMENARKSMEDRFGGAGPLDALSVVAGISWRRFAYAATIKASGKRIFALIGEMLIVERLRQFDDGEQSANTGVPGNPIEAYSPILQWLRGRD